MMTDTSNPTSSSMLTIEWLACVFSVKDGAWYARHTVGDRTYRPVLQEKPGSMNLVPVPCDSSLGYPLHCDGYSFDLMKSNVRTVEIGNSVETVNSYFIRVARNRNAHLNDPLKPNRAASPSGSFVGFGHGQPSSQVTAPDGRGSQANMTSVRPRDSPGRINRSQAPARVVGAPQASSVRGPGSTSSRSSSQSPVGAVSRNAGSVEPRGSNRFFSSFWCFRGWNLKSKFKSQARRPAT